MAAAVRTSAVGGSTTGTSDRTATITPASGDLLVVYCCVAANANDTPTCSDNNGGGTYDLIDVMNFAIAAVNYRMSVFIRTALMANTTSTVVTVATGSNTAGAVHVLAVTGVSRTGANAVRSKGKQDNQAAATPTPVLNQNALTANPVLVACGSADTTTSPPTNWTEIQDTNFANDAVALETAFRASGFTAASIAFAAAQSTQFASHAMELDITVLLTQSPADDANNLADVTGLGYGNLHADTVVLADTVAVVMGHVLAFSDNANNLADGAVNVIGALLSPADSLQALTEALAKLLSYELAFTDSEAANWADAHQLLLAQFLALSDTNTIVDAATVTLGQGAPLIDTLTSLSDTATVALGLELPLADSIPDLADDYAQIEGQVKGFSDALTSEAGAAVAYGLNFRSTADFVTDDPDQTYVLAGVIPGAYPITRAGVTFGYEANVGVVNANNRSTGVDIRLAGAHNILNDEETVVSFRVDLPAPGIYAIRLALGDNALGGRTYVSLKDNTSTFASLGPIVTTSAQFADAEGTIHSAANWPANNVAIEHEFTSSILRLAISGTADTSGRSVIAHLALASQGADPFGLADNLDAIGYGLIVVDNVNALSDDYAQERVSSERELILSDTLILADSFALGYGSLPVDGLASLTDLVSLRGDDLLTTSDSFTLSDTESHVLSQQLQLTDNANALTDAVTLQLGHLFRIADALPTYIDYATACLFLLGIEIECVDSDAHIGLEFYDSVQLTDSVALALSQLAGFSDSLVITDTETHALELRLAFTESIALTDSTALGLGLSPAESITLTDAIALRLDQQLLLADDIATLADAAVLRLAHLLVLTDTITITDACTIVLGHNQPLSDTVANLSDAETAVLGQLLSFTDTITLTDAGTHTVAITLNFSDAITLTDSVSLGYGLLVTDDANLLNDAILTSAPQGPLRQVGVTDALDGLTEAITLKLGYQVAVTDAISLTDTVTLNEGMLTTFSDILALTDATAATLGHLLPLADTLILSDSVQLRLGHELAVTDAIALTDTATLNLGYDLSLADNASLLADSVVKSVGLGVIIADNGPTLTDAIGLFSAGRLQLAETLVLTDALAKSAAGFLPLDDVLLLADSATIDLRGPDLEETLTDVLTLTDAIVISLNNELRLQIALNDTISLADHYFDLRYPYTPSTKRHVVVSSRARMTVVPAREAVKVPPNNRTTRLE